jgi:predicted ATPase
MINQLRVKNFKCFDSLSLPLAPLTLLTGFNAAGKSTTLQSLLLLAQNLRLGGRSPKLNINGSLAQLGTPSEVLNLGTGDLVFTVEDDDCSVQWILQSEDRTSGLHMEIVSIEITDSSGVEKTEDCNHLDMLLPFQVSEKAVELMNRIKETIYLSPIRIGTSDVFPCPESSLIAQADVGIQGEYAPWWFHEFIDEPIDKLRCHQSDKAVTLRRQFNAWAGELFPGAQGNALRIDRTNLVRLELRIGDIGDWRRPSNIGYGLTYAFPVLVAGLLAKEKQILIIDSPEAHLHPLGQSKIGQFLAIVAASGVQVIVETHSDHVLNGIRLAASEGKISPEKIAVHFFNHINSDSSNQSRVISPLIDSEGNLSEWPNGFFDQSEKDLARLAGWI